MRLSKVLFVSALAVTVSMLVDVILDMWNIRLGNWSLIALYLLIAAAFLYFPIPKRSFLPCEQPKEEYILDGKGQLTGTIFSPKNYTGYTEVDKNADGRILANSLGTIVCTRYIQPSKSSDGMSRIHLLSLCLISTALSLIFANLWNMIRTGSLEVLLQSWYLQKNWPGPESLFPILKRNLELLLDSIGHIHPKLDIEQCLEIIVDNLERLSIMYFD